MAVRRFGPIRGAGVRVEELDGDKTLTPAALGWTGYAGITEKGPVGKLTLCATKTEFFKNFGGIIPEGMLADCANDYYSLANGAGGLAIVRVTDGNELPSSLLLYTRRVGVAAAVMGRLDAANGGRWGGKEKRFTGTMTASTDLTNTTLQIEAASSTLFKTDEFKGGWIELTAVASKRYPIIGNSATGLVTVASDQTMKTDWATGPSLQYYLVLQNDSKALSVIISDGEESPDTEFSLEIFVDGTSVKKYGNLATDPASNRYWVNVINNDDDNEYVFATDLWTGAHTATVRPANYYNVITTVTPTVLTATIHTLVINSPTGGNPTMVLGATDDNMIEQTITITMTSATAGTAVSDKFGAIGSITLGTPYVPTNKWVPPFTVTAGATPLVAANTLVINYRPFRPNTLAGGFVYPDKPNFKNERYRIASNTHKVITTVPGSTLSTNGAASDQFMVVAPVEFWGGRDGNSALVDADYENKAWDTTNSPFNDLDGKNLGLVKFATPGITSTSVQKAGVAYAAAKNHQYRVEIPANVTTDTGALAYINDTIGRSDYLKVNWPSYGDVPHPDPAAAREGKRKTITLTGMIHGREARMAADFDGYHKAAAGTDAVLPRLLKIPTLDRKLNEELLNPAGINVIKKSQGNYVLWGDRMAHLDPSWKFAHQRELMSYYEHVLQENFDFIVFSINDATSDRMAETALVQYFMPEWVKRALRGNTFKDACIIKVDDELNTDAVRANGDKIASISLRLADTTERFIIRIGKQGIFEAAA